MEGDEGRSERASAEWLGYHWHDAEGFPGILMLSNFRASASTETIAPVHSDIGRR